MAARYLARVPRDGVQFLLVHLRHVVRPCALVSLPFSPVVRRSVSRPCHSHVSLRSVAVANAPARSVIHFFFSWFTTPNRILPDPFFRVYISNGHRSKHGSDTAVFDSEGRFIPAKFEEIFTKCVERAM